MSAAGEFLSEAQEIVEAFSRELLEIEAQLQRGHELDPDRVNSAFRAVHTLKGLASMGGGAAIVKLAHALESYLDALRLGRRSLDRTALDVMFESVELFGQLLSESAEPTGQTIDVEATCAKIGLLTDRPPEGASATGIDWIDESVIGVLTEYEEHRLRENLRLGRKVFRVHAELELTAIDRGIEQLKAALKSVGEVITYLPSATGGSDTTIELDILIGAKCELEELTRALEGHEVGVTELRRHSGPAAPAAGPPSAEGGARAPSTPATAERLEIRRELPREPDELDGGGELTLRSLSQTVRVDLRRLDALMNLVGELSLIHANFDQLTEELARLAGSAEVLRGVREQLRGMARKLDLLQEGILDVRMVPLGQMFDKLARVVRKLGREVSKEARLSISGADTELDKLIVEELTDPLLHMVRNALDHGIESPQARVAAGKPSWGRIDLRAYQRGNRVVIEIEDDGRGIDWRAVRQRAIAKGFVDAREALDLSPQQAMNLIFIPGFSTRDDVTELSGRGVGMDIVKTNIARLSGLIDVASEPGRGTKFTVTLPVTLAIIQALIVRCERQTFCVPLNSVLESVMVQRSSLRTIEGHAVVTLRGRTLPLVWLSSLFGLPGGGRESPKDRLYVVVVGLAHVRVGLVVDELMGQQDVVIKSLGAALKNVPGIAGATELGANRTVLLLDVAQLVQEAVDRDEQPGSAGLAAGRVDRLNQVN